MIRSRGRNLLNTKLRPKGEHSQQWLADALQIRQSAVSLWTRGVSRPDQHYREALEILWDIPRLSWLTPEERAVIERARVRRQELDQGAVVRGVAA